MQNLNQYLPYHERKKPIHENDKKITSQIHWKPINPLTFKLKRSIRRDRPLKIEEINQYYLKKIDFEILKTIPQENLEFIDTALANIHHKIGKKNLMNDFIQNQCLLISSFMLTSIIGLQYPGAGTIASFLIRRTLDKSVQRKLTKFIDNTFNFISKKHSLFNNLEVKSKLPYLQNYREAIVNLLHQIEYYFLITIKANTNLTKDQKETLHKFVRFQLDYALAKMDNEKSPRKDSLTPQPINNDKRIKPSQKTDQGQKIMPTLNPHQPPLPQGPSPFDNALKKLKDHTRAEK